MSSAADRLAALDLPPAPVRDGFDLEHSKLRTEVYELVRAKDRKTGKPVAIQRLLPGVDSEPEVLETFVAQARAASNWDLKHVLRVHFVARDDEGAYAVVEWPEQGVLEHRLARGPLSGSELMDLALGVATALSEARARGFLHGRVLANEVLLGADGRPLLTAFGIGPVADEPSTLLVDDAPTLGRPAARRKPTPGNDAAQLCQLIRAASRGRDGEPSLTLPPRLAALVARGLSTDRTQHFTDVDELLAVLEADATSTARAATKTEKAPRSDAKTTSEGTANSKDQASGKGEFPWRPLHEQYRIEGQPLHGGMGSVVRAIEIATGRPVAVKRMKNADPMAIKRFRREASAIARLNHPNVLQLMQAARDDDGDYLVLEWAPNGSLNDRLKANGKLPLDEVVSIAKKIGAALSYAHGKESIHRDVKPHNILLSESNEPKLADFGLARALDENTLTTTSGGAGSPVYMPPEQWQDSHHADKRSDVYAFAKTLYHLITGEKPAAIDKRLLPEKLVAVLKKATESDPDERHASIDEFVRDFCGAIERPTEAATSGRSSGLAMTLGVVLLVGLGAGIASQWDRIRPLLGVTTAESPKTSEDLAKPDPKDPRSNPESGSAGTGDTAGTGKSEITPRQDSETKPTPEPPQIEWKGRALRSYADVTSALAALEVYRGLTLAPQPGLLPLRVDPLSGLLEFAVESTGVAPNFLESGPYALTEEAAIVLVLVPGGRFSMGAQSTDPKLANHDPKAGENEGPVTEIPLAPFFLSKYELTQSQWIRLAGNNPSQAKIGATEFGAPIRGQNPVETVSWDEAKSTLEKIGLRLPSEAQFEYAARAGTTTPWFCGADDNALSRYANLADQATKRAHPDQWKHLADTDWAPFSDGFVAHGAVNSFAENPFGFVAIVGNVAEWCLDGFGPYADPFREGDGARHLEGAVTRVVRGGSFTFGPREARSAARQDAKPSAKLHFIGVRPARDISR